MPTFTEEKRNRVRESLRDTGRELFARHGVRKTTIAELTEPAGIGTGTFYQFYDSKEELYLDILEQSSEEVIPRLLRNSFEAHDDPETAIAALLEAALDEIESNPLFRQVLVDDEEINRIRAQVPDENIDERRDAAIQWFLPYIERWHADGAVVGPDPETIAHTIRAVVRLAQQKERIGADRYPEVRATLIAAVAAGLTRADDAPEVADE